MEENINIVSNIEGLDRAPNQVLKFIIMKLHSRIHELENQTKMKEMERKMENYEARLKSIDDQLFMHKSGPKKCTICQFYFNHYSDEIRRCFSCCDDHCIYCSCEDERILKEKYLQN